MTTTEVPPRVLQALDREGCGLRVVWHRDHDRYGHVIAYVDSSQATACLVSEPGRDRDPWPASPPLQQCSLEPSSRGRQMGLAVGMAGKSHWSQSVESDPASLSLTFDVACRVHQPPLWLGSSYRANRPLEALSASRVRLAITAGLALMLAVEAPDNSCPVRMEISGDRVAIVADLGTLHVPCTVRWRYRVALVAVPVQASDEAV